LSLMTSVTALYFCISPHHGFETNAAASGQRYDKNKMLQNKS